VEIKITLAVSRVKKEGYPLNYEFTKDQGEVSWTSGGLKHTGTKCGHQETIVEYHGQPVPPEGFILIRMVNGAIMSLHESRLDK
jgi:hypothetical protein